MAAYTELAIEQTHTSWTLKRDGQPLLCTLSGTNSGGYLLSIKHKGRCLLEDRCDSPQDALSRSVDALHALVASHWLNDPTSD